MREFSTGATRDSDENKLDYEGFLSPLVLERYAQYMHKNRKQADGKLRASDSWQKGIPLTAYMKSLWRHFYEAWFLHRYMAREGNLNYSQEEALCAVIFNASGYLHELLKQQEKPTPAEAACEVDKNTITKHVGFASQQYGDDYI
jgi:hypothetical protein